MCSFYLKVNYESTLFFNKMQTNTPITSDKGYAHEITLYFITQLQREVSGLKTVVVDMNIIYLMRY